MANSCRNCLCYCGSAGKVISECRKHEICKGLEIEDEMIILDYAADMIIKMKFLSVKKRKALITALYKEEV